ncbi:sensor histidine kinase [Vibrio panuliri]|uniref:histidine kinase n=1 Tax=Vibrio panuliri TaxID=1381081 RepID=A0ABX3F692_9VIBR|nr:HAMP domain-containing sensor histidine kinase [Vibrio panuliri]KAB1454779.1 HAMP domain-containing histidine kinase [Vibrio panuliri]OLQ85672.1 two-component sensor histidine kinase [Vibrio panuliri]
MSASIRSTKSLTTSLAAFFITISVVIGVIAFTVFALAIHWSEDRMGERRALLDRDIAIERFIAGENGKIKIDVLTDAYNDLSLVPQPYRQFLVDYDHYLGEVEMAPHSISRMVYKGSYSKNGQSYDIVLLSRIDNIEFDLDEIVYSSLIVVTIVSILMCIFGTVVYRLSIRLIEPLNDIAKQLESHSGNSEHEFSISNQAAEEFQILTDRLNQYRTDLNLALKREQAFARYASHELRTPLTVVKGATKLLARKEQTEFSQRQVERIDNATEQMITMVDALLGLVRYERNVDDIPLREINQQELETILADNSLQARDKQLDITLTVHSQPKLKAAAPVMNMVIGNLIRNAIAATPQGEISVEMDQDKIVIIDDGSGLTELASPQGHGLGLLIVEDLSRRYGWQFTLTNHATRGCIAAIQFQPNHDN